MNTKKTILTFFNLQRQIFGICPHSGEFFRLSDCKVFLKGRPQRDWMDKLEGKSHRLETIEERIAEEEDLIRDKAREKGRMQARKIVQCIDRVFTPRRLNPDDAKVLFHPIDYVVFNGMKELESMKSIVFLDREVKSRELKQVQRSIEKVVSRGSYEWLTLRVADDGSLQEE